VAAPFAFLICACALFAGGCLTAKRVAPKFTFTGFARPVVPPPSDIALADAPEVSVETERSVNPLVIPHGAPARPHVAPAPAPEHTVAGKPADPLMSPELTDAQLSAAKAATEKSLGTAERNLDSAKGKNLNTAQQDLVSKIQGFVDGAREAMKNNDWPRAQIQARKAEVLSQEIFPNP